MNIYNFIKETKEFISQSIANPNPLEVGKYLIPANATTIEVLPFKDGFKIVFDEVKKEWEYLEIPTVYVFDSDTNEYKSSHKNTFLIGYKKFNLSEQETLIKPLDVKEGFVVCFNETKKEWEYLEDNRNKTVYSTITKEALIVDYLGAIKEGFTLLVPTEFDKWENNSWVKDIEVIRASKISSINNACENAIISNFVVNIFGNDYLYQSQRDDQLNLQGLILDGEDDFFKCKVKNNITAVWELKPHTIAELIMVGKALKNHVKINTEKAYQLKTQINNSTTAAELELINWY